MASNDGIAGSKPRDDAGGGLGGMSRRAGVSAWAIVSGFEALTSPRITSNVSFRITFSLPALDS
jgi:hypothetical protein